MSIEETAAELFRIWAETAYVKVNGGEVWRLYFHEKLSENERQAWIAVARSVLCHAK